MTVNELKNHLAPYINIPFDFIILNRYISENKLEELDLPSRSLEDLNNNEIIHISIGESLHNSQYRGTIFLFEHSEQTKVSYYNNVVNKKCLNILFFIFVYRLF